MSCLWSPCSGRVHSFCFHFISYFRKFSDVKYFPFSVRSESSSSQASKSSSNEPNCYLNPKNGAVKTDCSIIYVLSNGFFLSSHPSISASNRTFRINFIDCSIYWMIRSFFYSIFSHFYLFLRQLIFVFYEMRQKSTINTQLPFIFDSFIFSNTLNTFHTFKR